MRCVYQDERCESQRLFRRDTTLATYLVEDCRRFRLAAERGGAHVEAVIGRAAAVLMKCIMPFGERVQQIGECSDVRVGRRGELIDPGVELDRVFDPKR